MVSLGTCCAETATSTVPYRRLRRCTTRNGERTAETTDVDHSAATSTGIPLCRSLSRHTTADEGAVDLKVAMIGDCESGKTCLMSQYVGGTDIQNRKEEYLQTVGMHSKKKCHRINKNVNIVFNIWELGGHKQFHSLLPKVCQDAAVIMIMFDLTRRSTLNSVKEWFVNARLYNESAIPVLVGTKYDQFIDFPYDIQLAITKQAMLYAKRMRASLFFSSTTHNINVHKIFKVMVAKLFDLQCTITRNYNFGEPIIAY